MVCNWELFNRVLQHHFVHMFKIVIKSIDSLLIMQEEKKKRVFGSAVVVQEHLERNRKENRKKHRGRDCLRWNRHRGVTIIWERAITAFPFPSQQAGIPRVCERVCKGKRAPRRVENERWQMGRETREKERTPSPTDHASHYSRLSLCITRFQLFLLFAFQIPWYSPLFYPF